MSDINKKDKLNTEENLAEEVEVDKAATNTEETSVEEDQVEKPTVDAEDVHVEKTSTEESVDPADSKSAKDDDSVDLPFMIGVKLGMTQIFSDDGTSYPVTVVQAGPCTVTQIKTDKIDGYSSIQLGFLEKKENKTNKSLLGHFKKSSSSPKKYLKEFRTNQEINDLELGSIVKLNAFNVGDMLTVTGYSKGRGFAGHMKRHNFSGGRASHGKNSVMRKAGSVGAGTSPGKVWKGTRMAGRMGNDKVTIKNLELIKVDNNDNLLFVSGSIPGANNKIVYINK